MSHLRKLWNCPKYSNKKNKNAWEYCLRALKPIQMHQLVCGSAEIHLWSDAWKCDKCAHWSSNMGMWHDQDECAAASTPWDARQSLNWHLWLLGIFFCKSLIFEIVNADSFCYFNNLYNPKIKFISTYLRPIVIHFKRPNKILLIPWEGIHDLSQVMHFPGTDSIHLPSLILPISGPCWISAPVCPAFPAILLLLPFLLASVLACSQVLYFRWLCSHCLLPTLFCCHHSPPCPTLLIAVDGSSSSTSPLIPRIYIPFCSYWYTEYDHIAYLFIWCLNHPCYCSLLWQSCQYPDFTGYQLFISKCFGYGQFYMAVWLHTKPPPCQLSSHHCLHWQQWLLRLVS